MTPPILAKVGARFASLSNRPPLGATLHLAAETTNHDPFRPVWPSLQPEAPIAAVAFITSFAAGAPANAQQYGTVRFVASAPDMTFLPMLLAAEYGIDKEMGFASTFTYAASPIGIKAMIADFHRLAPDDVGLCGITCSMQEWTRDNYSRPLGMVDDAARYLAERNVEYIIHVGSPLVVAQGAGFDLTLIVRTMSAVFACCEASTATAPTDAARAAVKDAKDADCTYVPSGQLPATSDSDHGFWRPNSSLRGDCAGRCSTFAPHSPTSVCKPKDRSGRLQSPSLL